MTQTEIHEALVLYGVAARSFERLAGGSVNVSYLVDVDDGQRVLTFLDGKNLQQLAALMVHVCENGISAVAPIASLAGAFVEVVGDRHVMLKPFVPGVCVDVLPVDQVARAGALLARIRDVAPLPSLAHRPRRLTGECLAEMDMWGDQDFVAWIHEAVHATQASVNGPLPEGLVHGDAFPDNFVLGRDGLVLLDWETASIDSFVMELAFAIVGLCRVDRHSEHCSSRGTVFGKKNVLDVERLCALLGSYTRVQPLDSAEKGALRDAVRYACAYVGFHRYRRHNVVHPNPARARWYEEMPVFAAQLGRGWGESAGVDE